MAPSRDMQHREKVHDIIVLDMFLTIRHGARMSNTPAIHPAEPEDIIASIAFALHYDGRKRVHDADRITARITAERLVRHLQQSGFVIMKSPPGRAPSTSAITPPEV
jgi:hypothetical protein